VTAIADLISQRDRERLAKRLAELAGMMRERGSLPSLPEPEPLQRMSAVRKDEDT
jgi:hypothetical protein